MIGAVPVELSDEELGGMMANAEAAMVADVAWLGLVLALMLAVVTATLHRLGWRHSRIMEYLDGRAPWLLGIFAFDRSDSDLTRSRKLNSAIRATEVVVLVVSGAAALGIALLFIGLFVGELFATVS